ncbi:lys-63-specific deubiquitinase BRCC36-like isoform X2 [Tubulanus polymorphus]|uniref:lys-63-specific deubiquitinase BRCC36-like isoform X1 n=1 Tax=Tubulanus polymorphus TaxID=672921 RepID=UPI003DA2F865
MAVSSVYLECDVYMVCLAHALSTEREEVMGLLIGEMIDNRILHISSVIILRRSDKQPDRVEISPEQLSDAAIHAERLTNELKRPMRVLGWYHSHPHITVWPSHVDVRTQAMYQLMDDCFIGLIFSVYSEDKQTKQCRIQVTCFQSVNQSPEGEPPQYMRIEIPLHIKQQNSMSQSCLESLVELPKILTREEEEEYERTMITGNNLDLINRIHNGAVFSKSLCHIMEVMSGPLMHTLESRLKQNELKLKSLSQERDSLLKQLKSTRN